MDPKMLAELRSIANTLREHRDDAGAHIRFRVLVSRMTKTQRTQLLMTLTAMINDATIGAK